jgi:hypothetical protein
MRGTCLIWTANPNKIRGVVSPATEITYSGEREREVMASFPNFKPIIRPLMVDVCLAGCRKTSQQWLTGLETRGSDSLMVRIHGRHT